MHRHADFPKWKYHATKEARIVPHKEAEEALGEGWVDSPAHVAPSVLSPQAEKIEAPKPEAKAESPKVITRKAKA